MYDFIVLLHIFCPPTKVLLHHKSFNLQWILTFSFKNDIRITNFTKLYDLQINLMPSSKVIYEYVAN